MKHYFSTLYQQKYKYNLFLTQLGFEIWKWKNYPLGIQQTCRYLDVEPKKEREKKGKGEEEIKDEITKEQLIYLIKNMKTMHVKDKSMLNNVGTMIKKYTSRMNIQEIYLVLHSFCKLNFPKYSLNSLFVKHIMNHKPIIESRMLTQILLDLHKMESLDINVLTFFTEHYIKKAVNKFSLFDISMILYIFNKYNYDDMEIVHKIGETIKQHFSCIINEDKGVLTTILLSTSILNLDFNLYYELLITHVYKKYEQFEIKYLCNLMYSIVLRIANRQGNEDILRNIASDIIFLLMNHLDQLKNEELKQMHIVLYFLKNGNDTLYDQTISLIEKKKIKDTITTSKMQQQIEKILKEIGLKAEKEYTIGPYVLDFALKKKKICIEVNGFTHYYTFSGEINAKTKLKYSILDKLKWTVVTIEYTQWKNKTKDERIRFLESHIRENIR